MPIKRTERLTLFDLQGGENLDQAFSWYSEILNDVDLIKVGETVDAPGAALLNMVNIIVNVCVFCCF